jgi:hypothetical protein
MPEVTESYIRLPVNPRSSSDNIRTISISTDRGIKALYNISSQNIATYLFSTKKWTMAEARKWVQEHNQTTKMISIIGEELKKVNIEITTSWKKAIRDVEEQDKILSKPHNNLLTLAQKVIPSNDMVASYDVYQDVPPRQKGPKLPKRELIDKSNDVTENLPVSNKQTQGVSKQPKDIYKVPSVEPGLWELGSKKFLEYVDNELEKILNVEAAPGGEGSQGAGHFGSDVYPNKPRIFKAS